MERIEVVLGIGLVGRLFPALRAARLPVAEALRVWRDGLGRSNMPMVLGACLAGLIEWRAFLRAHRWARG